MHSTLLPVYSRHCYLGLIWYCWVLNLFLSFWSRSVALINSSNVSLPTPSLDLPDVADLFAPPADNASRKRESNGSALHDSCSKFPRMQSQPRGIRSAAGNTLIPPQLRGRLVFLFSFSQTHTQLTNQMLILMSLWTKALWAVPECIYRLFTLCILYPWVMSIFWLLLHRSNVVTEDMSKLFVAKRKE
jgi:hypothetical protein